MPFGAEVRDDGRVHFRLWAPAAQRVDVVLIEDADESVVELEADAAGCFEVITARARHGTRYRFMIDGGPRVPDPASRMQSRDVHDPSVVVDPHEWTWSDAAWRGRPWEETVLYELHVGAFTHDGTFTAAIERLDHLRALGVTAVELMPVADFPGRRNWGYDGTLPFAPDRRYGTPEELKALIDAAHGKGLMVFLDVVYNHFGPEGNYLHSYAPQFFAAAQRTPWGDAINVDGADSEWVREFFVHNALYWLEEYHVDGLRLDAVHAIIDRSAPGFLDMLAARVAESVGADRHVHLVLENDDNATRYLRRDDHGHALAYVAQWNDDIHHALHVLLTGEDGGYYRDYSDAPATHLGRCLSQGFAYQGESSSYRDGRPRGEASDHLPPTAFVSFLQNHDQIGNRARGERITELAETRRLRAAMALILLAPSPPLLFMGQEWGCRSPFPFFCDFSPDFADAVRKGRHDEFAALPEFRNTAARAAIPDPMEPHTFRSAVLDWDELAQPAAQMCLAYHRDLLSLRHRAIVPRVPRLRGGHARTTVLGERALAVDWASSDGGGLAVIANLGDERVGGIAVPAGQLLYATSPETVSAREVVTLAPWSVAWYLNPGPSRGAGDE